MKLLIVTSDAHWDFVSETCKQLLVKDYLIAKNAFWKDYDVGISFMYQHRVPAEELSKTWINFHPGPLPKYKGRNLCYHALMNGETQFGASVHYMDEGFDTGDIIDVWTFPILPNDTAESLSAMAMQTSYRMFEEYLPAIMAGLPFHRIRNVGGHYYRKEPIKEFVTVPGYARNEIRAITYGDFYPKINIGGDVYKVVKE